MRTTTLAACNCSLKIILKYLNRVLAAPMAALNFLIPDTNNPFRHFVSVSLLFPTSYYSLLRSRIYIWSSQTTKVLWHWGTFWIADATSSLIPPHFLSERLVFSFNFFSFVVFPTLFEYIVNIKYSIILKLICGKSYKRDIFITERTLTTGSIEIELTDRSTDHILTTSSVSRIK